MTAAQGASDTVLAFDFGLKRIGVAVGNRLVGGARPLTVIEAEGDARRFEAVGKLIAEWGPQRLVVGRPCHPDGTPHDMTARCERFARQLDGRYRLPVHLVDERYTSAAAAAEAAEDGGAFGPGGFDDPGDPDDFGDGVGADGGDWREARRAAGRRGGRGAGGSGGRKAPARGPGGRAVPGGGRAPTWDAEAAAIILRQYWSESDRPA